MMRGTHGQGWRYLEALEAMWGLAAPLIGPASTLAAEFVELARERADEWEVICLSGLLHGSPLLDAVIRGFDGRCEVVETGATVRHVASLRGGIDGFLGRRSKNFRRNLRRALSRAADAGIQFEPADASTAPAADATLERILAVERRSWKGLAEVGIDNPRMSGFYRAMLRRLGSRGADRVRFAHHDGADVAFILGGTFAHTYRGLQMSQAADYRSYELGNLCQYHEIVSLCADGVTEYDLGTAMEYKERWAEIVRPSPVILVVRSR
jgi:CelD/BcsL family acetyltransferase involved in cellulose biosynthesis